jgi:hypothetical protein
MKIRLTIRGVEIIPSSETPDAANLAFLIRAILATEGMTSPGDEVYIAQVQQSWLKLPQGLNVAYALAQFVLGMDASVDGGVFSGNSLQARVALANRAARILAAPNPPAFIREQVLYTAGIKGGPRPADLAMLKGGEKEDCGLDSIIPKGNRLGTVLEEASLNFAVAMDLDLTLKDLDGLVSQLRSGTTRDQRLANAIINTVLSGARASNGADKTYQLVRRNRKKLKKMAGHLKASKGRVPPLSGGIVTQTILGEYILSRTSDSPVQHGGNMGHSGLVYKPTNMDLDESKPTKSQVTRKKRSHK